ncbi:MAG: hypothetical protein ABW022_08665 [Actinoplanes sp.]
MEKNPLEARVQERLIELPPELVKDWQELETLKMIAKRNEAAQKEIRERIGKFLGDDGIGTIDGRRVVKYEATDSIGEGKLEKAYPETHAAYLVEKVKHVFDLEAFKKDWPDLFEEFRTRRVSPVGSRTL